MLNIQINRTFIIKNQLVYVSTYHLYQRRVHIILKQPSEYFLIFYHFLQQNITFFSFTKNQKALFFKAFSM